MMQSKFAYRLFGKMARFYTLFLRISGYARSVEYFVSQFPVSTTAPVRVLDVGCGTGIYTMAIARRFPNAEIVAFDLNTDMVEQLKSDMQAQFPETRFHAFTHDIQTPLTIDDIGGPVDLVVTSGVLEYAHLTTAVQWLVGLLKSEGIVAYSPLRDSLYGKIIGKIYQCLPYTREESATAFAGAGYHRTALVTLPWYHPAAFKELHIYKK